MKNYIQKGAAVSIPAPHAVASGGMVVAGVLAGVAGHDAEAGEAVEVHVEGVYDLAKVAAQAWTVGQAIYVNATSRMCTGVAAAGTIFIGVAIEAAANPSNVGRVRLNGSAPEAPGA